MKQADLKQLLDAKPANARTLSRWIADWAKARAAQLASGQGDWSFAKWWSSYER